MVRRVMEGPLVQLAVRVPKPLHHEVKLHCVENGLSMMDFIVAALEDRFLRVRGRKGEARGGG